MYANLPLRDAPPWHFRLAKWMIRNRIAGGYHLVELGEYLGWLNHLVRYRLSDGVSLDVPMNRRENQWAWPDLLAYERPLIDLLVEKIGTFPSPVTWIDCGADIGTVSALVVSRAPNIARVFAVEPNATAFDLLKRNFAMLPYPGDAIHAAVADYAGRGGLSDSPTQATAHSRFLEPHGFDVDVMRLDDYKPFCGSSLAIKIDVEGGELAVLRGALKLLESSPGWVVACEAHRDVFHRTGIDPSLCVRLLFELGAREAIVAEAPEIRLDPERLYFEQVPLKVSNVVCTRPATNSAP